MSGSMNRVTLIGNLCRDVEVRTTQAGKDIANLSIATSERWKDKATGEHKEASQFHRVVIFNDGLVRVAKDYLRKGSKVLVEGQLQHRKWTDTQGVEKYATEVVLQSFDSKLIMLDGKRQDAAPAEQYAGGNGGHDDDSSSIPF